MAFLDEVIKRAREYDASRPRSLQTAVGWSEVGGCRAALGYRLDGAWATDETDTWAAQRGTAIHEYLEPILTAPGVRTEVDTIYRGIPGHADLVEPNAVVDFKTTSKANSKLWAADHSLLKPKRIQVHGYAAGLVDAGELPEDCKIRLLVIPVDGTFADWWAYEEKFDRSLADEGADRLDDVRARMTAGETLPKDMPYAWCETWCLAAETEVVTRHGIKPISKLAGETHRLLTPAPGGGVWHDCAVRSYGTQPLYRIQLRRGRSTKVIHATADHLWMLQGCSTSQDQDGGTVRTADLQPRARLRVIKRRHAPLTEVPFAVAQGFVYGDGSLPGEPEVAANLPLYENSAKPKAMLPYFTCCDVRQVKGTAREDGWQVAMLPRSWKAAPDLAESPSFLLSWLAGYIAADGTVSPNGQLTISSANRSSLELVRSICAIVGVGHFPIATHARSGEIQIRSHGAQLSDLHTITLDVRDLPEWTFKLEHHRVRVMNASARQRYFRPWIVESVTQTDRAEEVFCAVVEGRPESAFALADELLTHNCQFFSLCRDPAMKYDGEEIADPELAAAVSRYGEINAQIRPLIKEKEGLDSIIRGLRGVAGDWRVSIGEASAGKEILDEDAVRADYAARGVPVPEVTKPGNQPRLNVTRIRKAA